jgi:hypothetical protein
MQNFGYLLQPLIISSKSYALYDIKPQIIEVKFPSKQLYINKLYISSQYKICLSIPFNINIEEVSTGLISKNTIYKINKENTIENLHTLQITIENLNSKDGAELTQMFNIYYTGDLTVFRPGYKDFIIKTNRYSKLMPPIGTKTLFEYDDIKLEDVSYIINNFFI